MGSDCDVVTWSPLGLGKDARRLGFADPCRFSRCRRYDQQRNGKSADEIVDGAGAEVVRTSATPDDEGEGGRRVEMLGQPNRHAYRVGNANSLHASRAER